MPQLSQDVLWKLRAIVGEDHLLCSEPLSLHTSFHIGGPAECFITPDDSEEVREILACAQKHQIDVFVLGAGSDLLVGDLGIQGIVLNFTEEFVGVSARDNELSFQSGVSLREAAEMACEMGLSGLEFASGIPGSIGGACFMNAGAYGGSISDILKEVCVLTADNTLDVLSVSELKMGYRTSRIAKEGLVVLSATFALKRGEQNQIRSQMEDLAERRAHKQPLELPSAGSTFKRPEGYFAGKLISDAGLQGERIGDAQVSEKHAGFVVNLGAATADDVARLVYLVQQRVFEHAGVALEPELRFVGNFSNPQLIEDILQFSKRS